MKTCSFELAKFFAFIIAEEHDIEILKEMLNAHPEFEPEELFNMLDKQGRGYITKEDVIAQMGFTERDSVGLIKYFTGGASMLTFSEFARRMSCSRRGRIREKKAELTVESIFVRLLEKYANYYHKREIKKMELTTLPGFSILDLFQTIDIENRHEIDLESLSNFMASQSYIIPSEDAFILLDTFDSAKRHKWTLLEFLLLLSPDSS